MEYKNDALEIDGLGYNIQVDILEDDFDWDFSTLEINEVVDLEMDGNQPPIEPTDYHYTKVEEYLVNEGAFKLAS